MFGGSKKDVPDFIELLLNNHRFMLVHVAVQKRYDEDVFPLLALQFLFLE